MKVAVEPYDDQGTIKWYARIVDKDMNVIGVLQALAGSKEGAIQELKKAYLAEKERIAKETAEEAKEADLKSRLEVRDVNW